MKRPTYTFHCRLCMKKLPEPGFCSDRCSTRAATPEGVDGNPKSLPYVKGARK